MKHASVRLLLSLAILVVVLPIGNGAEADPISPPSKNLTDQEIRGRALLLQRCALCHLPQLPRPRTSYGPSLSGLLKDNPAREKAIREIIMRGTPRMPGFQYGLEPKEIDDIIAFMKAF